MLQLQRHNNSLHSMYVVLTMYSQPSLRRHGLFQAIIDVKVNLIAVIKKF